MISFFPACVCHFHARPLVSRIRHLVLCRSSPVAPVRISRVPGNHNGSFASIAGVSEKGGHGDGARMQAASRREVEKKKSRSGRGEQRVGQSTNERANCADCLLGRQQSVLTHETGCKRYSRSLCVCTDHSVPEQNVHKQMSILLSAIRYIFFLRSLVIDETNRREIEKKILSSSRRISRHHS